MRKHIIKLGTEDQVSNAAERKPPGWWSKQPENRRVAILQFAVAVSIIFCLPELLIFIEEVQSWLR